MEGEGDEGGYPYFMTGVGQKLDRWLERLVYG